MQTRTRVLIRLGRGWSPVGTARVEEDAASGMKMLHLEMSAMAQDVYVPMGDLPALSAALDCDEELMLSSSMVGHA